MVEKAVSNLSSQIGEFGLGCGFDLNFVNFYYLIIFKRLADFFPFL